MFLILNIQLWASVYFTMRFKVEKQDYRELSMHTKFWSQYSLFGVMYKLLCLNYIINDSYMLIRYVSKLVEEILGPFSYISHYYYLIWITEQL